MTASLKFLYFLILSIVLLSFERVCQPDGGTIQDMSEQKPLEI